MLPYRNVGILAGFKVNFLRGAPPQSLTSLYYEPLVWFMIKQNVHLIVCNPWPLYETTKIGKIDR